MPPPAAALGSVVPHDAVTGAPGAPAGGTALHTQPTLAAMITTELSGSPIVWQCRAHCWAESGDTGWSGAVPTIAGVHPIANAKHNAVHFIMAAHASRLPPRYTISMTGFPDSLPSASAV